MCGVETKRARFSSKTEPETVLIKTKCVLLDMSNLAGTLSPVSLLRMAIRHAVVFQFCCCSKSVVYQHLMLSSCTQLTFPQFSVAFFVSLFELFICDILMQTEYKFSVVGCFPRVKPSLATVFCVRRCVWRPLGGGGLDTSPLNVQHLASGF